jgi:hypothetical protein
MLDTLTRYRLGLADHLEFLWWRLLLRAARLAGNVRDQALPVVLPVKNDLWIPAVALLFGILIGWGIVLS